MPYLEQTMDAANVAIGAFVLNRSQLEELDDFESLQASLPPLPDRGTPRDRWLYLTTPTPALRRSETRGSDSQNPGVL